MVAFNRGDLDFILQQIKIAEQLADNVPLAQIEGGALALDPTLPFGLRTVSGLGNNLIDPNFGAADQPFPNQVPGPVVPVNEGDDSLSFGPESVLVNNDYGVIAENTSTHPRAIQPGDVVDADPRIISNLTVDQSLNNPAAVFAALKHAGIEGADAQAAYNAIMLAYTAGPGTPNPATITAAQLALDGAQANLSIATALSATNSAYVAGASASEAAKNAAASALSLVNALSAPPLELDDNIAPATVITAAHRNAIIAARAEATTARDEADELLTALDPAGTDFVVGADLGAAQSLRTAAQDLIDDLTSLLINHGVGSSVNNGDITRLNNAVGAATALNNNAIATDSQIDASAAIAQANANAPAGNLAAATAAVAAAQAALVVANAGLPGPTVEQVLETYGLTMENGSLVIEAVAPDEGLSAPANGWFTLFGQFFDHGLDLVAKGGYGTVYVPLQADDPLRTHGPDGILGGTDVVPASRAFMTITRATRDENGNAINTTSPFVDQNQTYASHKSHQVFLRAYDLVGGKPQASGKLIEGSNGGMATWLELKQQAALKLGILLTDNDVTRVPLLASDAYGNFIPHPVTGMAQIVLRPELVGDPVLDPDNDGLASGTIASPIAASLAVASGHAFLDDIAHNAAPGTYDHDGDALTNPIAKTADLDSDTSVAGGPPQPFGTFDNELLDKHFVAGDGRVNENIGLTTVHHVFHSEHNRLVEHTQVTALRSADLTFINEWLQTDLLNLTGLPPATATDAAFEAFAATLDWDGERVFQAAKFGTEMQYQHLVFEEFARKVQPQVNLFAGYDITIDPKIVAEFAHAVYRFGHSQLRENVDLVDAEGNATSVGLIEAFLNPVLFNATGAGGTPDQVADIAAGAVVRGMSRQVGNHIDEFVTGALRNNLLGLPLDLATINIARARETGVPTLNEFREQMHALTSDPKLTPYTSWIDFAAHAKHELSVVNFIAAYGTHSAITSATTLVAKRAAALELVLGVDANGAATTLENRDAFLNGTGAFATRRGGLDNVDLWIGGLAEAIEPFGGLLGSTFNFVFEIQLEKLQDGDRFYYLTRTAGLNFLTQLEGNSFASLIQRNTDLNLDESNVDHYSTHLPADIFSTPTYILEAHVALQQDFDPLQSEAQSLTALERDLGRDPTGGGIFRPLVIRRDGNNDGNAEYLEYTGVDHVVLGGTNRGEHLKSGIGDDALSGDGGNDTLEGGDGADVLIGGTGDDILIDIGGAGDNLKGGDGNDVLISGSGEALLLAGSGKDYVLGGQDLKETFGGEGDDFVNAGDSSNTVFGGEGSDWIEGGDQADLLQGDNGAPFQDSTIIGNDVILGGGGNDDYDAESGDDILVADTGITRHEGMLGFDWVTHKDDPFAADTDFFFTGALFPAIETNRDRFDMVEGLSGWQFDDTLRGDNADAAGGLLVGHELTNFNLISGLRGTGAANLFAAGTTSFTGGNIILGGGGSDVIEGRGGNDIIDGDRWLNVRLEIRTSTGAANGTTDSMQGVIVGGTFAGQQLNMLMENGLVNPGNLHIVREILNGGVNGDVDYAEFSGNIADYTVSSGADARGFRTVTHLNGGIDGVDLVRNVEVLQFADGRTLFGIANSAATGELDLVGTPAIGQTFSLTIGNVADSDGLLPDISSFQVIWQVELDAEAAPGVFTDIVDPLNGATFTGATFTPLPGMELESLRIRARASFIDAAGLREVVVSEASLGLAATTVTPATNGDDTIFGTLAGDMINALAGDDIVFGLGGNDTFIGGPGNDILDGGADTGANLGDVAVFLGSVTGATPDFVFSLNAEGVLEVVSTGVAEEDAINSIENLLFIDGPALTNAALTTLVNQIRSNPPADGVPTNVGGGRTVTVRSVAGILDGEVITGTAAAETLVGGDWTDVITGGGGDDAIEGGIGNDTINGDGAPGAAGDDTISWRVGEGRDRIDGGGNATVAGDVFDIRGSGAGDIFRIYSLAAAPTLLGPFIGTTEVVVTRQAVGGLQEVIAELDNIESLVINNVAIAPGVTAAGGDIVAVIGNLTGTSLNPNLPPTGMEILNLDGGEELRVTENVAGAIIGNAVVIDPTPGDTHSFTITRKNANGTEVADNRFEIVDGNAAAGQQLVLKLKAGMSLDYETDQEIDIVVRAFDSAGNGSTNNPYDFTVFVGDVAENSVVADIAGTAEGDERIGTSGGESFAGLGGDDDLRGRGGDDTFFATSDDGDDNYRGGTGRDTYDLSGISADVTIDRSEVSSDETGDDTITSIENFVTGAGDDTITTNGAANIIASGDGEDTVNAGGGNDTITGGAGADALTGGKGKDVFVYLSGDDSNDADGMDVIFDFKAGKDKIDLSAFDLSAGIAEVVLDEGEDFTGVGALDFYGEGAVVVEYIGGNGADSRDARIYVDADDDGNFSDADLVIELQNITDNALSSTDFIY